MIEAIIAIALWCQKSHLNHNYVVVPDYICRKSILLCLEKSKIPYYETRLQECIKELDYKGN